MKEFIEKLIKRLEKLGWVYADYYPDETEIYDEVVKIVNELVEEYKPKTRADKIRSMSDEELAGLTITYNDYYGEYYCSDEERYDSYEDAIKHEIEWLQSEAE